jgi:hypothetical protein
MNITRSFPDQTRKRVTPVDVDPATPCRIRSELCLCCGILCQVHLLRLAIVFGSIGLLAAFIPLRHNPIQVMTPLYQEAPLLFMP